MSIEKRRYQRIDISISVQLLLSSGETITVSSANLSTGGMALRYEAPAKVGTKFELSFSITSEGDSRLIRVLSEVIHQHLDGAKGLYVIGMKFIRIDEGDSLALDHLVKSIDEIRSM